MKLSAVIVLLGACASSSIATGVKLESVPEGGVQPQVAVQPGGAVHLVYLKEQAGGADIRYTRRAAGSTQWDPPVTVNSVAGSAVATGTIRGAQLALGKSGRVHVVWNGGAKEKDYATAPLLYARMADDGKSFSPQQNLLGETRNLDGGASIAATEKGGVFIVWHASPKAASSESDRLVYVTRSTDDGKTFTAAAPAGGVAAGVCPCCSLKAFTAPDGSLLTLYRNALAPAERDMTLLVSGDGGLTFKASPVHPWPVAACPMSSAALTGAGPATRAAWETNSAIYTSLLSGNIEPVAVSSGQARHPALAVNARGETLVSWSIGTGWKRGGELGWVILDAAGKPGEKRGTAPGVPVWSHTAAFAAADGDFVILH
ncbi:MAG TPA: sialidase family protein [Verrucomicrobiales bacterium]|nr:sialidase family protein [Verrucomicrobiales bacterium]